MTTPPTLESRLRALCGIAPDATVLGVLALERIDLARAAAALGDAAGYARGVRELHSVALNFAADVVRMGLDDRCPGGREHIDREIAVERTMKFKRDIDAIRTAAANTGNGSGGGEG